MITRFCFSLQLVLTVLSASVMHEKGTPEKVGGKLMIPPWEKLQKMTIQQLQDLDVLIAVRDCFFKSEPVDHPNKFELLLFEMVMCDRKKQHPMNKSRGENLHTCIECIAEHASGFSSEEKRDTVIDGYFCLQNLMDQFPPQEVSTNRTNKPSSSGDWVKETGPVKEVSKKQV